jgi:hypothetical protein
MVSKSNISNLLTAADFVVEHSFRKQKGQKDAKRTKKESFCYFCPFFALFAS